VFRTGSDNEIGEKQNCDPREWHVHSELSLVSNGIELFSPSALQAFRNSQRGPSHRVQTYRALEI